MSGRPPLPNILKPVKRAEMQQLSAKIEALERKNQEYEKHLSQLLFAFEQRSKIEQTTIEFLIQTISQLQQEVRNLKSTQPSAIFHNEISQHDWVLETEQELDIL